MRRPVLTTILILAALAIAFGVFTVRRADLREAGIEAAYPVIGQLVDVDGRKVHVLVKGSGPDLVFIHGAGSNLREPLAAIGDALSRRFRVFFVDRPGHGWTEAHPSKWAESPAEQAAILARAVESLGARDPLVVGHSFGGAVAMAWALDHSASGIVVLSGATMPWPGALDISYRVLGTWFGRNILAPLGAAYVSPGYVDTVLDQVFEPQPKPSDYANRAGIALAIRTQTIRANNMQVNSLRPHLVDQSKRYPEVELPVEILHGTADTTVYVDIHAEPLDSLLPNARLTILDSIGHMPHFADPDSVLDVIDRVAERAGLR